LLQVIISTPDFSNGVNFTDQIILENADDISLRKSVAITDESISFNLPQTDPKASEVTFLRWWECWDTETNERKNYGPIDSIEKPTGGNLKISGPGRSAILRDVYKTTQTFYKPIDIFIDDLRYENVASEPRTSVLINTDTDSAYYGLSNRTKDAIIDENTGYISPGRDTPIAGIYRADQFWAGTGKADWITVDLGAPYTISRSRVLLPWWGSTTDRWNRTFDWTYQYSLDNSSFTTIFDDVHPHAQGGYTDAAAGGLAIYTGETPVQSMKTAAMSSSTPIEARYWKINITNTYAYYNEMLNGNDFRAVRRDEWQWQCNGSNHLHRYDGSPTNVASPPVLKPDKLRPQNDCYASVVEVEIDKKILDKDVIPLLYYQQINNDSRQITYYHLPDPSETVTVGSSRKFEPGTLFRKARLDWSTGYPKVYDEFNNLLAEGDSYIETPAYARLITIKGSSDATVYYADTWPGKLDPLSYNANYSYSTIEGDTAILHFRGVSLKWYITVPEDATPGEVSIEFRQWYGGGAEYWGNWVTLVDSLILPTGVHGYKVWEIEYESGILHDDTVYELRITNLNGGYVSIDAFAGYWSGSFTDLNENDPRLYERYPNKVIQKYGEHFSFGSTYVIPLAGVAFSLGSYSFYGDRVILYGAKGPNLGTIKLQVPGYDLGDIDGSVTINLDSNYWIYQAVLFDSKDYIENMNWGWHDLGMYQRNDCPGEIYFDGVGSHSSTGLSVKFANPTSHLEILKSTLEALTMEGEINEKGIRVTPRLGKNTDIIMKEGTNVLIELNNTEDVSKVATMLQVKGADIDGLPLSAVVEDKNTRREFGRTIQRDYDLNNVSDYFTLIGAARVELIKRKKPERRLTVSYVGPEIIAPGDSFIAKKKDAEFKVRATSVTRNQGQNGTTHEIECEVWPIYDESLRYDQELPKQTLFMKPALAQAHILNPEVQVFAQAAVVTFIAPCYAQAGVSILQTYPLMNLTPVDNYLAMLIQDGATHVWKLDEAGPDAIDYVGGANLLYSNGIQQVSGPPIIEGSLAFTSGPYSDSIVYTEDPDIASAWPMGATSRTIEVWAKHTSGYKGTILSLNNGDYTSGYNFRMRVGNNYLRLTVANTGVQDFYLGNVDATEWHLYTIVFDASAGTHGYGQTDIYIDGGLYYSTDEGTSREIPTGYPYLKFGGANYSYWDSYGYDPFEGDIAFVSIYNEALSGVKVWSHAFSAPISGSNPVAQAMAYIDDGSLVSYFDPPITTQTVYIPGGIDQTGVTDTSNDINTFIASIDDGSVIEFPSGATYRLDQGIQFANRNNLVFEGNATTLIVGSGASASDQLASSFVIGHTYGGYWAGNNSDIEIRNFYLQGNDSTPGTFTSGQEAQAAFEVEGATRLYIHDCVSSAYPGDFVKIGDGSSQIWLRNNTVESTGRNGVSVIDGSNIMIENNTFTTCGYCIFDVEPNSGSQSVTNAVFKYNTIASWGNAFFALEGSHTGAAIDSISVQNNNISTSSLLTIADNGNTSRMLNVIFTDNISYGGSVSGPVLTFAHIDGLTVTGNTQTHTGSLTSITDCTDVTT
jgi:hypothetical protein